jgi:hypothetical protein
MAVTDHDHDVMTLDTFLTDREEQLKHFPRQTPEKPRERVTTTRSATPEEAEKVNEPEEVERKPRGPYKPTKDQLEIAMRRIQAALIRNNYIVDIEDEAGAINFCKKRVRNRRDQLGSPRNGDFDAVIVAALDALDKASIVKLDKDLGRLRLVRKPKRRKRHSCNRPHRYGQRAT